LKLVVASAASNKELDRDDNGLSTAKKSASAMLGAMAAASLVGALCMSY